MGATLAGLSLRDLEYAAAVDRLRHFGKAAAACHVSQAGLSEQLRKLEDLLGVRLFERGNRRVEPTAHGVVLLRQMERVLREAHGVLELARVSGALEGVLRLGAIATLGPYYLPHLLQVVRAQFQGLALELTEGQTAQLLEQVRLGALDAVLMALPIPGEGLELEPLFREPFLLACPAEHGLAERDGVGLEDLQGDDLLLLEEGHCLREQTMALCHAGRGRAGRGGGRRHATSVETLWQMIAAGEGISLVPGLSAAGRGALSGLVRVRPLPDVGRTVALAWRRTDPRGTHFRTMAAALRAGLPEGVEMVAGAVSGGR